MQSYFFWKFTNLNNKKTIKHITVQRHDKRSKLFIMHCEINNSQILFKDSSIYQM